MVALTIKQASQETGKDRTTLLRAIQKGIITAKKDVNNSWTIEASELFRVYERTLCTQGQNAQDSTSTHIADTHPTQGEHTPRTGQKNEQKIIYTQTDVDLAQAITAKDYLERQVIEQKERIELLESIIADLKQDKETYRHQIKAITDQREKTVRKKVWGIF